MATRSGNTKSEAQRRSGFQPNTDRRGKDTMIGKPKTTYPGQNRTRSGSRGGAAPVATPGNKTVTTTTNPPAVAPFLTPAQQRALSAYDEKYGIRLGGLTGKLGAATTKTQDSLYQAQRAHDIRSDNTNQVMAARGLFQSSIRAGALNDLDANLTIRQNLLNTNLRNLALQTNSEIGQMATDYAVTHNTYNDAAVQNAAGQMPVLPTTTTVPAATATPNSPKPSPIAGTPAGPKFMGRPLDPNAGHMPNMPKVANPNWWGSSRGMGWSGGRSGAPAGGGRVGAPAGGGR
jgi:hypothetical protein